MDHDEIAAQELVLPEAPGNPSDDSDDEGCTVALPHGRTLSCRAPVACSYGQLPLLLLHIDYMHMHIHCSTHVFKSGFSASAYRQYNAMTEDALEDAYSQYIQRQGQRDAAARRRARLQAGSPTLLEQIHCTQQAVRCVQTSSTCFEVLLTVLRRHLRRLL